MGQVYQCWSRICREIYVYFFQVRISHVLRYMSICDLFTGSPSYYLRRRNYECPSLFNFSHSDFCIRLISKYSHR
jgi:hypothetical protein